MTEQPSNPPTDPEARQRVIIHGLPGEAAFSARTRSVEFTVPVSKAESLSDDTASIRNGEPMESENGFPGVQNKDEAAPLITSRAEARNHKPRHGSPEDEASATPELIDAAKERLARILGAASIIKDEILDTRELKEGDNGDDIYVGRHRPKGDSFADRKPSHSNRVNRAYDRFASMIAKKKHDRREGHLPEYTEPEPTAPEAEATVDGPQVGDNVELGGVMWTVEVIDGDEVTLQREGENGEVEIEVKSVDVLNNLVADPEQSSSEEMEDILDDIRSRYAGLAAERTQRAFESKKKTGDMKNAREEMSDMIGAVATQMMDEIEAVGFSKETMAGIIDLFVDEQMEKLVREIEAERAADYDKRRPLTKAFLDKWAKWSEPTGGLLSKDRFKSNLKKSAFFVVPGAALGLAAAPLAAGAAAGTAAFLAGRSVGRHLMGARISAAANASQIARHQASELRGYLEGTKNASHTELLDIFDKQTEKHRKRNRNRLIGGTAVAMTAGILSKEVADYINESGAIDKVGGWVQDRFNDKLPVAPEAKTPVVEAPDRITAAEMFDGSKGSTDFSAEGLKDFNSWINKNGGYEVQRGDSVWKISEKYLEAQGIKNPSKFQIDAVKDDVLKELKAKGFVDRKGWLKSGDIIKLK